jgi:hypothetical protein
MGIIEDLGIAGGFVNNKVWRLISLDDPQNKFIGQFQAQELTENVGAKIPETNSVGLQQPAIQWQSGETETVNFKARIYRTSPVSGSAFDALSNPVGTAFKALTGGAGALVGNGSVRDQIEKLKNLSRKNSKFGRQERFIFTYGTEIEYEVFIKSLGGIAYDDIRSDGTIRGASFEIQLLKIRPENLKLQAGVSLAAAIKTVAGVAGIFGGGGSSALTSSFRSKLINIPGASLHTIDKFVKVKQGDTFEGIAAREYGNPILGDILRRAQPDKADLKEGQQIVTIKRDEVIQIVVTPQSVALKDKIENKLLFEDYLNLRNKPSAIIV